MLYEVGPQVQPAARAQLHRRASRDDAAGRVVAEFFYLALETDFRPQLRRVKEFGPDVVFLPGSFTDATLVAAQARAVGAATRPSLGGDAWSSPLLFQRGGPPGRGLLRRAVLAARRSSSGATSEADGQRAARAAARSSPTTPCG